MGKRELDAEIKVVVLEGLKGKTLLWVLGS